MPVKDLCGANGVNIAGKKLVTCKRKRSHLKHHSKYERQHMDSRAHPIVYWDPTEEELSAAKEE